MKNLGIRSIGSVAVALLFVVTMAGIALGTASSSTISVGSVYGGGKGVCSESVIADVADNKAYTSTYSTSYCAYALSSSSGHLGANALGYRDGAYCGSTGFLYNGSATWKFGVGSTLCSNPSGYQTFKTKADSRVWDGASYKDFLMVTSPNQTY